MPTIAAPHRFAACAAFAFGIATVAAQGASHTLAECAEAADFIANAASSRDNGYARDAFLARMRDDFVVIRSLPPALRWFAKDERDEQFLLEAAAGVWDAPRTPDAHRAAMLARCLARASA